MTDGSEPALIRPRALRPGARVALVAPAGPIQPERLELSAERCRSLELEPVVFPGAAARQGFLAGPDRQRLQDLQNAFDDPAIDGIWALRGGYGTLRILSRLDLGRQRRAPIPFVGFSDNTTIHALHLRLGVISFHGPHPGGPFPPETEASFRRVLFADRAPGILGRRMGDPHPTSLVSGRVEAPLVGGNLAMLASLCGSREAITGRDRILFFEDTGEPAYRVDRMLVQLERAGALAGVQGLAFGRFADTPGDDEGWVTTVIAEFAARVGVPAVADLPFGHVDHNSTLPVGGMAVLDGDAATLTLSQPAVASA